MHIAQCTNLDSIKRVIFEQFRIVKCPALRKATPVRPSGLPRDLSRSGHARRALPVYGKESTQRKGRSRGQ